MKKNICFVLSSWIEITTSEQWSLILILDYTNKFHQNKEKIIPSLYNRAATGKNFINLPNYVLIPEFVTEAGGWGNGIDTLMECLREECPIKWRSIKCCFFRKHVLRLRCPLQQRENLLSPQQTSKGLLLLVDELERYSIHISIQQVIR